MKTGHKRNNSTIMSFLNSKKRECFAKMNKEPLLNSDLM